MIFSQQKDETVVLSYQLNNKNIFSRDIVGKKKTVTFWKTLMVIVWVPKDEY